MPRTQDEMDEQPAVLIANTSTGERYDLNNISGIRKAQLMRDGEADLNTFAGYGDNISGVRKKALLDAQNGLIEEIKQQLPDIPNVYKVGDTVKFKNLMTEILEVDASEGVKIRRSNGVISKWIHHSDTRLEKMNPKD